MPTPAEMNRCPECGHALPIHRQSDDQAPRLTSAMIDDMALEEAIEQKVIEALYDAGITTGDPMDEMAACLTLPRGLSGRGA